MPDSALMQPQYCGRFAPTPSGPLHFGSLIAALGSFLDARSQHGRWLVRIEDIDPPREVPGAATTILRQLEAFGLQWDAEVSYQSQHSQRYLERLEELRCAGRLYACRCSRKQINATGGLYNGHCRDQNWPANGSALRLRNQQPVAQFTDRLQGRVEVEPAFAGEDFILRRRDGLFAYQLAVVSDDIAQGVNNIVRGADLLEVSCRQLTLYRLFGAASPSYLHLPLAIYSDGHKLSKQNGAAALDTARPAAELQAALRFLGYSVPAELQRAGVETLLAWAIPRWRPDQLPQQRMIAIGENQTFAEPAK